MGFKTLLFAGFYSTLYYQYIRTVQISLQLLICRGTTRLYFRSCFVLLMLPSQYCLYTIPFFIVYKTICIHKKKKNFLDEAFLSWRRMCPICDYMWESHNNLCHSFSYSNIIVQRSRLEISLIILYKHLNTTQETLVHWLMTADLLLHKIFVYPFEVVLVRVDAKFNLMWLETRLWQFNFMLHCQCLKSQLIVITHVFVRWMDCNRIPHCLSRSFQLLFGFCHV